MDRGLPGAPKKVLLVEDEAIVALDLERSLVSLGYEVTGKPDTANEAVALAGATRPDVVLMDIRLRGPEDGTEAAFRIRNELGVPVVYLTAHADPETLRRAYQADPFGFLRKPYEESNLKIALEIALRRHDLETKLRTQERAPRISLAALSREAAHELNNVLAIIRAATFVARGEPGQASAILDSLETIDRAVDRGVELSARLATVRSVASVERAAVEPVAGDGLPERPVANVLVVDDEPELRRFTAEILRRGGYAVREAANAACALQIAAGEEPIDLLVTDVRMPGLDGISLWRRLCRTQGVERVVFLSGHPGEREIPEGEGIAFLKKPFAPESLQALVRRMLC